MLLAAAVTVLLIEHDIGLVMNLSDHCVECSIRNGPTHVAVATALAPLRTNFRDNRTTASGRYGAGELAGLSFSTTSVAINFSGAAPSFMPT